MEPLIRRHYEHASPEDYFGVAVPYKGVILAVVVLRRKLMLANKYRFLLSKQCVNITERELLEGGALIRVAAENRLQAHKFAKTVLDMAPRRDWATPVERNVRPQPRGSRWLLLRVDQV